MSLKISSMDDAARRAVQRAAGTTGGIFVMVGWNGTSIVAGDKVLKSLPHIRINVLPGDAAPAVAVKFAMAVVELKKSLPSALRQWKRPPPPKPTDAHGWSRPLSKATEPRNARKKK